MPRVWNQYRVATETDKAQNYLLFGHILKCSVVPKAQVHEDLFKGGNKRFKVCSPIGPQLPIYG